MKQRKKEAQPNPYKRKLLGNSERKLNQDTWGFLETWDPWDMQHETSQDLDSSREHAHERKEQGWICPINRSMMQKKADGLGISTS